MGVRVSSHMTGELEGRLRPRVREAEVGAEQLQREEDLL